MRGNSTNYRKMYFFANILRNPLHLTNMSTQKRIQLEMWQLFKPNRIDNMLKLIYIVSSNYWLTNALTFKVLDMDNALKAGFLEFPIRQAGANPTINLKRLLYSGLKEFKMKNELPP